MKPYIVNRCEIRRLTLQNSEEVSTSLVRVCTARPIFSALVTSRLALAWAFFALAKKYSALRLCSMSRMVPPATRMIIRIT